MGLEDNPMLLLAIEIYKETISLEEAISRARSPESIERMDVERCREILTACTDLIDSHRELSTVLSYINLASAEAIRVNQVDEILWAQINELHAQAMEEARRPRKALEHFTVARDLYRKKGLALPMAMCELSMGNLYRETAWFEDALESFRSARIVFQENDMTDGAAGCDMNMANVYVEMAERKRALELFLSSGKHFEETRNLTGIAKCKLNMAYVHLDHDEHEEALDLLRSARSIFENIEKPDYVAVCELAMGTVHVDLGLYDEALEFYNSAKDVSEKEGMIDIMAKCIMNMGMVHCLQNDLDTALNRYELANDIFTRLDNRGEVASCHMNMALIHNERAEKNREHGKYDTALRLYRSAREIFEDRKIMDGVAMADMNIGLSLCSQSRYDDAGKAFKSALVNPQVRPGTKSLSLYGMGNVSLAMGKIEEARASYREAVDALESVRNSMTVEEFKSSFLESNVRVYMGMIEFCLGQEEPQCAIEYIERLKSRNLSEMLARRDIMPRNTTEERIREYRSICARKRKIASLLYEGRDDAETERKRKELSALDKRYTELIDEFKNADKSFDPDQTDRITYEGIKELAGDDLAIIVIFPMESKTAVFVISKSVETTTTLDDFGRSEISGFVDRLDEAFSVWQKAEDAEAPVRKKQWKDCLDEILKALYEKLFGRILGHIAGKGIKKLVLIPYAELHLLPLHAASYKQDGTRRYLLDDYCISYAPSAKILKLCMQRKREMDGLVVVASSDPNTGKDWKPLLHSRHEAAAILKLFEKAKKIKKIKDVKLVRKAMADELIEHGYMAGVLHYTGHASPDALLLHASKTEGGGRLLRVEDIFEELDLPKAYLVSLGGCKTGVVPMKRGLDEYIGLPSAFLHAGAAALISSLWPVGDIATSLLMKKTYELILAGRGRAEALNQAQAWLKDPKNKDELIKNIPSDYRPDNIGSILEEISHPLHWAGFICSGSDCAPVPPGDTSSGSNAKCQGV